jgi:predicted permease
MTIAELETLREFLLLIIVGFVAIGLVWLFSAWGLKTLFNYQDRKRAEMQDRQMKIYNTNDYIWGTTHDGR